MTKINSNTHSPIDPSKTHSRIGISWYLESQPGHTIDPKRLSFGVAPTYYLSRYQHRSWYPVLSIPIHFSPNWRHSTREEYVSGELFAKKIPEVVEKELVGEPEQINFVGNLYSFRLIAGASALIGMRRDIPLKNNSNHVLSIGPFLGFGIGYYHCKQEYDIRYNQQTKKTPYVDLSKPQNKLPNGQLIAGPDQKVLLPSVELGVQADWFVFRSWSIYSAMGAQVNFVRVGGMFDGKWPAAFFLRFGITFSGK